MDYENETSLAKESLSKKVIKGGTWVFGIKAVSRIFTFLRIIIIARILAPEDFGLFGIAMLTMMTLETFSQTGFKEALVQKKKDISEYLNSAWTVTIIRGIILFGILYFIAPYAATFFDAPQAEGIIQIIGLSILFLSFTNIAIVYFQKELDFKRQFIFEVSGALFDFIVAISAAFILKNVWALVFGVLAGHFVRFIVSYIVHPYRPKLDLNLGKAKELFGFGKWILGSSILIFLITQGDDIFVGKVLGVAALGFYQMAYKISNMPATEITKVISQVTFPAYSKLQDNILKLKKGYSKTVSITMALTIPITGLIFIFSNDFTRIVLGEKWLPIVPIIQILSVFGLTRSFGATTGPLFQGIGKPKILTYLTLLQLILLAIIIYPLTIQLGIYGTSIAVVLANLITQTIAGYIVIKLVKTNTFDFIKPWFPSFIAVFVSTYSIFILQSLFNPTAILLIISLIVIYCTLYIFAYLLLCKLFNVKTPSLIMDIIPWRIKKK